MSRRSDSIKGAVAFGILILILLIIGLVMVVVSVWTHDARWAVTGAVCMAPFLIITIFATRRDDTPEKGPKFQ